MRQDISEYYTANTTLIRGTEFGFPAIDRISQETLHSAARLDWHVHKKSIEVISCLKGVLHYELRHHGMIRIPSGSFTVIPAGIEHRHIRGLAEPGRRFSFFLTPPSTGKKQSNPLSRSELRELSADLLKKRLVIRPIATPLLKEIRQLADMTMNWTPTPPVQRQILLRARALSILVQLAVLPGDDGATAGSRMMNDATRWLSSHYRERVNINDLVRYIGYGRSRFFTLFQQNTGLTPNEWLIRYRIDKARKLLANKSLTIAKIAAHCGFNDAVFFSRIFKNRMSVSPRDYRKQNSSIT